MVIHIGPNDITKFNYIKVNAEDLAHRTINTGLKCRSYVISNIAVSSIFLKKSFNINQVMYQVNNILKRLCRLNDFIFIHCFKIRSGPTCAKLKLSENNRRQ